LKDLIRAAVALNLNHPNESPSATLRAGSGGTRRGPRAGKSKSKPKRTSPP
jgi:hypothetical protein